MLTPTGQRAAEYVRMSTEHQRFSTLNQQACLRDYAQQQGLSIVHTYLDEGRSGLQLKGRDALQQLLADVTSGNAPYDTILVYDVSRWGRFQDADEAAHYEFICRRAGKRVIYCAEPFDNDQTPMAALIKNLKRVMAGEYSRELSDKVLQGQLRSAAMGHFVGGPCPYGLRRLVIDADGRPVGVLEAGQRKALQRGRVLLIPGPAEEVTVVRRIFTMFVEDGLEYVTIAKRLNAEGVPPPVRPGCWTKVRVRSMLRNEKYIGNNLFNRCTEKLSTPRVPNPVERWVRVDGAFAPIVDTTLFHVAAERIEANPRLTPQAFILTRLRDLLRQHGRLSAQIVNTLSGGPTPYTLQRHFGSLDAAFQAVGYDPAVVGSRSEQKRQQSLRIIKAVKAQLVEQLQAAGATVARAGKLAIRINDGLTLTVTCPTPHARYPEGRVYWRDGSDALLVVEHLQRSTPALYLVPRSAITGRSFLLRPRRGAGAIAAATECAEESVVQRVLQLAADRLAAHPWRNAPAISCGPSS